MPYVYSNGERVFVGQKNDTKPGGTHGQILIEIDKAQEERNLYQHDGINWALKYTVDNIGSIKDDMLLMEQCNALGCMPLIAGEIKIWAGTFIPLGWLLCDGSSISRVDYSRLFSVIGTTYGNGNGSTTFNLPNLKGRVPVGQDSSQTEFNTIGYTGGEKTHKLTVTEMPSHTHGAGMRAASDTNTNINNLFCSGTGVNSNSTGGDQSHNNLQPYVVLNYIIKY